MMSKVRLQLAVLLRRMADAESGHRGYLLTSSSDYLAPYRDASRQLRAGMATLDDHYGALADDPGRLRLKQLEREVSTKLSEFQDNRQGGRRVRIAGRDEGDETFASLRAEHFEFLCDLTHSALQMDGTTSRLIADRYYLFFNSTPLLY